MCSQAFLRQIVGQPLDIIAAAPRVDDARGSGFVFDEELRVARDAGGEVGRQGQRLVERVGVQRLRAAMGRGEGFDAGARDVVEHVLRGERPAARLAMRAQAHRLRVLRAEIPHEPRPKRPRGPHLGDFHEVVHANRPEEREARRERVDIEARRHAGAHIFDAVRERIGQLQVGGRAGFLHVIAGDRDRVELRHLLARIGEDVGDDAHGRQGRIDVGVPHHELFEDVVLDRARKLGGRDALLLAGHDEQRQDWQHRAVHGHGYAHLGQRDAVEQGAHIVDGIDGNARHAHVAAHAGVVAIVAAVRGEVEGDRKALLAAREIAPVEGVRILRRGEARILPDGPGLLDVHGGIGAAQERRQAWIGVQEIEALDIARAIGRLKRDPLGRFGRRPRRLRRKRWRPPLDLRKIRQHSIGHLTPSIVIAGTIPRAASRPSPCPSPTWERGRPLNGHDGTPSPMGRGLG